MSRIEPLDVQWQKAKRDYPYLTHPHPLEFHLIFPDFQDTEYSIFVDSAYPETPPTLTRNEDPFTPSLITYWSPSFTLTHVIQNLHLYEMSKDSQKIKGSPPLKRSVPPVLSPTSEKPRTHSFREFREKLNFVPKMVNEDRIGKSSAKKVPRPPSRNLNTTADLIASDNNSSGMNDSLNYSIGDHTNDSVNNSLNENENESENSEYENAINELKARFRKKEINMNQFIAEFSKLQALKQKR
ncbi:hypothetical protein TRFO_25723 [Tritrichomonas foetus]|uniref:Uncharacterized protein n=1 Tax=Tritrichomonas foetus TaxID=1144522 RepID=A0A1J4K5U6_9EUKA|nr:hypothetical protein TRFO_25723 [Tritrichomonas foetus]|eukprot:OHT06248.1 hypothetical protein TRFO_25723 [Tritrichomonas foetus]